MVEGQKIISIKAKLIRMQIVVALLVLMICSAAFIVNDFFIFQKAIEDGLTSTARVLGRNLTSPISFLDGEEAQKVLSSLQAEPSFVSSYVFDAQGKVFSQYGKEESWPEVFTHSPANEKFESKGQYFGLYHKIYHGSDFLGTLYIKVDTLTFASAYKGYLWIALVTIIIGITVAVILANFMQRSLSNPIIKLASMAKEVTVSGNYNLRMPLNELGRTTAGEVKDLMVELNRMLDQIQIRDQEIQKVNEELEKKVEERTSALKEAQKSALDNAHAAGMAEIATGILHNIGNIVNSINTSCYELRQILTRSKVPSFLKANQLLQENLGQLSDFFTQNPKGQALPQYYLALGESFQGDQNLIQDELESMTKQLSLIKDVIQTQQGYANQGLFFEEVPVGQLVEEVLKMQNIGINRHNIRVVKEFSTVPKVKVQRVKFAHVLVNIIKNAKEALKENDPANRILKIEINQDHKLGVYLKVVDNGEGIDKKNTEKIFSMGFTTKKTGHGFGLHFCFNAMTEMGGKLIVESEGKGKGCAFTMAFQSSENKHEG